MLKFIWGRGQGPTAERVKLQKELFNFSKNVTYGFPSKPGDALLIFGRMQKFLIILVMKESVISSAHLINSEASQGLS